MMPTFPWSLPEIPYGGSSAIGFKAGGSGGAFPSHAFFPQSSGLPSDLRAFRFHRRLSSFRVEGRGALVHLRVSGSAPLYPEALAPDRVIVSRYHPPAYSAPSVPLASTSHFHRLGLYETPSRCVIPQRLGDPRVVPCFRWLFSVGMSPSETREAGRVLVPSPSPTALAFDLLGRSRHFLHPPPSDSRGGVDFGA